MLAVSIAADGIRRVRFAHEAAGLMLPTARLDVKVSVMCGGVTWTNQADVLLDYGDNETVVWRCPPPGEFKGSDVPI
ncbi:MAG TPA: hypothetical protein VK726_26460 [Acetobacteraceae bacterium]|jgi:hypothetical protein|nr:hypothetical protein [Acetobacteraceae bacterium]